MHIPPQPTAHMGTVWTKHPHGRGARRTLAPSRSPYSAPLTFNHSILNENQSGKIVLSTSQLFRNGSRRLAAQALQLST